MPDNAPLLSPLPFSAEAFDSALPAVFLLDFSEADESEEADIAKRLPPETRDRLLSFSHPARRRQSLWGRLLALLAARLTRSALLESPPYAPSLIKDGKALALSIAHTGTFAAIGIPGTADPVTAIDLEAARPVRRLEEVCRMSLGPASEWTIEACARQASDSPFYLLWGMHEAAVKLSRGSRRFAITLSAERRPQVADTETGRVLAVTRHREGNLHLTVLTGSSVPRLFRLTPAELLCELRRAHADF